MSPVDQRSSPLGGGRVDGDAVVDLTRRLVRIRSVNRPEAGLNEAPAAELVAQTMRGFGWDPLVEEVMPGRPNVIVRIEGGSPGPTLMFEGHTDVVTEGETFRINTMSTYNVFSAAVQHGLERIVWASSETLIGLPFEHEAPRYAPIDEDHPRLPEFHYALSKLAGEVIAEQFNRWSGIPFIALRISNIMEEHDYTERFPRFWDDATLRAWNLWGYVDARDVAQAVRLSLTADVEGAEPFLVAASDTCMPQRSADLMAEVYPEVEVRATLRDRETLLSIDKARAMLGYEPIHSWPMYVEVPT